VRIVSIVPVERTASRPHRRPRERPFGAPAPYTTRADHRIRP